MERIAGFTIGATAVAALAVLVATAVYAQDKYSPEIAERNRVPPTSKDMRIGRWSLLPGPTKYSR